MVKDAEILTKDTYGDKVIRLKDGRIAKFFRLKRIMSSALLWPYAKRFVRGARILKKNNIPTVNVTDLYKVISIKRDMVVYQPLEGESLRDLIREKKNAHKLVSDFASFFAGLHDKGIYFRAIHFNNVFITSKGEFGLIDISDLYYSFMPLTISKRVRNFKPFFHYDGDRKAIQLFSIDKFLDIYVKNSKIKSNHKQKKIKKDVLKLYGDYMNKTKISTCPICSAKGAFAHQGRDLLYNKKKLYIYMKCTRCSAEYQHPMPDSETINTFYPDVYYEEITKLKEYSSIKQGVLKTKYNYSHIRVPFFYKITAPIIAFFIYKDSIPFKPDSRGLDIGCGNGRFISSMNKLGWQFEGVEFSSKAVDICHKAGLKVFKGELKAADFQNNSFDLVSARHLIEHIPDPDDLFKEIYRILKPKGHLILRTPNSQALGRKWFGLNWFPDDIPRHLILFNSENLNMLAEKHNMQHVKTKTFSSPRAVLNSIDYLTGNRKKPSVKQKLRRLFAKFFVGLATVMNRGEELFVIYEKK
jgi:SAM-dependent methyltransferase/tRNA A-37 threonylcarbamoyl transferase component Bud32